MQTLALTCRQLSPETELAENPSPSDPSDLDVEGLTWSVLLARWVEFAQAAVAWPDQGEDAAWKRAVPDIIQLQALWFALGQADRLGPAEQALARDRSAVSLEQHVSRLISLWGKEADLPEGIAELVADVRERLASVGHSVSETLDSEP